MKFFLIAFAVIAAVAADVSHLPSNDYLPPQQESFQTPSNDYLPPVQQAAPAPVQYAPAPVQYAPEPEPAHEVAQDGYRYKTNRRVVYRRHRRDVSHLPSNDYLPPQQESFQTPSNDYLPPVQQAAPAPVQYAPAPVQYAPAPVHHAPAPVQYAPAPVQYAPEPEPAHEVAQDGYRYKTNRRVVYRRHRRDVSHLPSNDYLPPQQEQAAPVEEVHYEAPVAQVQQYSAPAAQVEQYSPAVEAEPAHELAQDGYRYKTHRRVVYRRHRRDVSHLPSNDYLPPQQEQAAPVEEVHYEEPVAQLQQVEQYSAPAEAEPAHELAQDGYRYKTHRRVVYRRHRRDVSHLPSNDYLPPQQESFQTPSNDYLPPVQQAAPVQYAPAPVQYAPAPVQYAPAPVYHAPAPVHHAPAPVQYAPAPVQYAPEPEPAHEVAQDGYRYKTNRRVVYRRHRRDVSHLPSNDYLPPQQEQAAPVEEVHYEAPVAQVQQYSAPAAQVEQYSPAVEAEPAHELAQDGYRYKTHRRVVYRRH